MDHWITIDHYGSLWISESRFWCYWKLEMLEIIRDDDQELSSKNTWKQQSLEASMPKASLAQALDGSWLTKLQNDLACRPFVALASCLPSKGQTWSNWQHCPTESRAIRTPAFAPSRSQMKSCNVSASVLPFSYRNPQVETAQTAMNASPTCSLQRSYWCDSLAARD